jgi:hypothetical protein
MASLEDWTGGRCGAVERVDCEVRRLDRMVANRELPQPDFVKCDVEGAEGRVFEGARSIVERADAPIVLFEANARSAQAFGESTSSAAEWLAGLTAPAYRFFRVQPHGTLVPIAPTLTDEHDHFNLVAVPAIPSRAPGWNSARIRARAGHDSGTAGHRCAGAVRPPEPSAAPAMCATPIQSALM